jgi:hypothetical protein
MIEIRYVEGRFCPFLVCDRCGQPIERAGNILWLATVPTGETVSGPFSVHKPCNRAFEAARPSPDQQCWLWAELPTFLWQLVGNAHVDLEQGGEWHRLMGQVGP